MRIAFFELKKWEEEYIKEKLKGHKLFFFNRPLTEKLANKIKDFDIIVVFIYSNCNKNTIQQLKKLKYITTMSTGYDHIDIDSCRNNNIKVSNVPSYGENTVAEHAFALILSLSKKIQQAVQQTKQDNFSLKDLMGFDLKGKTLGVIGPGKIGQHVIKIANGFEMNVLAYSPEQDKKLAKKLNFKFTSSLNELLKKSDIITIHVPLLESTKHMISMRNIKYVKRGAYLINTARGEIIDTNALLYALDNKILAGAGLDVLEGEEEIKEERQLINEDTTREDWETFFQNHLLLKDKNVVITPHSAFYTKEALQRILDTTIDNIRSFVRGNVKNRVV